MTKKFHTLQDGVEGTLEKVKSGDLAEDDRNY